MPATAARLRRALRAIPQETRDRVVAGAVILEMPGDVPPWTKTGIELEDGESFSVYAEGRIVLSEEAGLWNGPRLHLWGRVGACAPLLNGGQDTCTFEAPIAGALELGLCRGEWSSRDGEIDPAGYVAGAGQIDVLVIRWKIDAREGASALAAAVPDEPLFAAEAERLAHPVERPEGWHHLWFLGESDIFSSPKAGAERGIRVETHDDVGILQKPVDLPFAEDTRIRWRWKLDQLPSAVAENSLLTHDYISIAVEFENGQDLTYYWSADLAVGEHFRCPLPNWDQRETHWVLRSGSGGLGEWQTEDRPLHADYCAAVGDLPQRIVAVWLIAVSVFQKGVGCAELDGVGLCSGDAKVSVL